MTKTGIALKLFQKSSEPLCAADITRLAGHKDVAFGRDTTKNLVRRGVIKPVRGTGTRNDPRYYVVVQPTLPPVGSNLTVNGSPTMSPSSETPSSETLTDEERHTLLGGNRILTIKMVRDRTGLPLKESLAVVDAWREKNSGNGRQEPSELQRKIRWLLDGIDLGTINSDDALVRIRNIVG